MKLNKSFLKSLTVHGMDWACGILQEKELTHSLQIDSIILYGSAAKFCLGRADRYGDFDLNVFLRRLPAYRPGESRRLNKRRCWCAGEFKGKRVDVFFNLCTDRWEDSAKVRRSARWRRICTEPIIQIHPQIVAYEHL